MSRRTENSELKGSRLMRELITLKHQQFLSPHRNDLFRLMQLRREGMWPLACCLHMKRGKFHNQSHPGIHFGDFIKSLSVLNYWIRAQKWHHRGQEGVIWFPHIPCLSESSGQLPITEGVGEESKVAHLCLNNFTPFLHPSGAKFELLCLSFQEVPTPRSPFLTSTQQLRVIFPFSVFLKQCLRQPG